MAGGEYVGFNNSVFLAEREVSDRNYALAYYMKENKCFPKGSNIKDCLDFWYQVCLQLLCKDNLITSYKAKRNLMIQINVFPEYLNSAVQWKLTARD